MQLLKSSKAIIRHSNLLKFFCLICVNLVDLLCRRAKEALRQCLPDQLKDQTFYNVLKDDTTTKRWLSQLIKNLQDSGLNDPRSIPMPQ